MCCCDKEGLLDRLCESPVVVVAVCAAVPKICANDGAWCNPPLLLAAAAAAPDSSTICETWSLPPAPETIFTSCINSVSSANVCAPSAVSVPPGVVSVSAKQREERRAKQNQFCHVRWSAKRETTTRKKAAPSSSSSSSSSSKSSRNNHSNTHEEIILLNHHHRAHTISAAAAVKVTRWSIIDFYLDFRVLETADVG